MATVIYTPVSARNRYRPASCRKSVRPTFYLSDRIRALDKNGSTVLTIG
jgi:hypothetical protein